LRQPNGNNPRLQDHPRRKNTVSTDRLGGVMLDRALSSATVFPARVAFKMTRPYVLPLR